MNSKDIINKLIRDNEVHMQSIATDLMSTMQVVHMLTQAVRDLNERLIKLEGGTDDIDLTAKGESE